jgi:SAM-dependent methyltransferase
MSLVKKTRSALRSFGIATSHLPVIRAVVHANVVRDAFREVPIFRSLYQGFGYESRHPFDRTHGTDTSGFASANELPRSEHAPNAPYWGSHYWGSQPSFVRSAIAALPSQQTFTFIDLGCGKGRTLLVASEFHFRDIVGVELSPTLAKIARKNAQIIKTRFPGRTGIVIKEGDASAFEIPSGNIVVYLYNPFGEEILSKVIATLEAAIAAEQREVYVVYMYPSFSDRIDASPVFKRFFETRVDFAPEERGYGDVSEGKFIIWRGASVG